MSTWALIVYGLALVGSALLIWSIKTGQFKGARYAAIAIGVLTFGCGRLGSPAVVSFENALFNFGLVFAIGVGLTLVLRSLRKVTAR